MLSHVAPLKASYPFLGDIEGDHHREVWDAIRLGDFEPPSAATSFSE
jgi:hypothetical protein